MQNDNIVQQLIRGSQNIDQMRKEIDQVVKMVVGLAYLSDTVSLSKRLSLHIETLSGFHWSVTGNLIFTNPSASKVVIEYWEPTAFLGIGNGFCGRRIYSLGEGSKDVGTADVQKVHSDLAAFVNGMKREFSGLTRRLKPLLDASTVF